MRWLWLAPLFSLLLWSKMTNPLPLIGVLVVWQVLRGQLGRAGLHLLGIGIGGGALFLLSWTIASRWLGFPLDMPFGVNLVQWQDSSEGARRAYTSPGRIHRRLAAHDPVARAWAHRSRPGRRGAPWTAVDQAVAHRQG